MKAVPVVGEGFVGFTDVYWHGDTMNAIICLVSSRQNTAQRRSTVNRALEKRMGADFVLRRLLLIVTGTLDYPITRLILCAQLTLKFIEFFRL